MIFKWAEGHGTPVGVQVNCHIEVTMEEYDFLDILGSSQLHASIRPGENREKLETSKPKQIHLVGKRT